MPSRSSRPAGFDEIKDVNDPGARAYADRFTVLGSGDYQLSDGTYHVMRNGQSSASINRTSLRQLRSTVVLRWEYRPGSNGIRDLEPRPDQRHARRRAVPIGRDLADLGSAASENIVMVKATTGLACSWAGRLSVRVPSN